MGRDRLDTTIVASHPSSDVSIQFCPPASQRVPLDSPREHQVLAFVVVKMGPQGPGCEARKRKKKRSNCDMVRCTPLWTTLVVHNAVTSRCITISKACASSHSRGDETSPLETFGSSPRILVPATALPSPQSRSNDGVFSDTRRRAPPTLRELALPAGRRSRLEGCLPAFTFLSLVSS